MPSTILDSNHCLTSPKKLTQTVEQVRDLVHDGLGTLPRGGPYCPMSKSDPVSSVSCTIPTYCTFCTFGGVQLPSRIDGAFSLGQYMRIMGMNSPSGAGSQFDSLFLPGESFWKYSVIEPSGLAFRLSRGLTVNLFSLFGTNHQPWSIRYMVIDQKP